MNIHAESYDSASTSDAKQDRASVNRLPFPFPFLRLLQL